jgi:hypothetical protein
VLLDEFSSSGSESDKAQEQQQVSRCCCLILWTVVMGIWLWSLIYVKRRLQGWQQ